MTTRIRISGQIESSEILLNAFNYPKDEVKNIKFNGFVIEYENKNKTLKALKKAYEKLESQFPENKQALQINEYSLVYGSSTAFIIPEDIQI